MAQIYRKEGFCPVLVSHLSCLLWSAWPLPPDSTCSTWLLHLWALQSGQLALPGTVTSNPPFWGSLNLTKWLLSSVLACLEVHQNGFLFHKARRLKFLILGVHKSVHVLMCICFFIPKSHRWLNFRPRKRFQWEGGCVVYLVCFFIIETNQNMAPGSRFGNSQSRPRERF